MGLFKSKPAKVHGKDILVVNRLNKYDKISICRMLLWKSEVQGIPETEMKLLVKDNWIKNGRWTERANKIENTFNKITFDI